MQRQSVTIVVPVYNEEDVLQMFYDRATQVIEKAPDYDFELLFVDDGSSDRSKDVVDSLAQRDQRVSYIGLSRNFGKERAILAALDSVNTDAAIIIDADLQDPPELMLEMLEAWSQGYQDVYAQRRSRAGETWMKKMTASLYYRTLQSVTKVKIQKDTGDYRLLDRVCIDALRQFRETERNSKAMFSWIGFRKLGILYDRDPRAAGKTKFNYRKLTNLAVDGLTSFTTAPLRFATFVGIFVSILAFIYLAVIVVRALIFGSDVAGYPSMMATLLFLGGVQLLSLGIIGEYVGRIFNESKQRPPYLIGEVWRGTPAQNSQREDRS